MNTGFFYDVFKEYSTVSHSIFWKMLTVTAGVLVLLQIILTLVLFIMNKNEKLSSYSVVKAFLKGLRRFLYFLAVYVFLRMIYGEGSSGFPHSFIIRASHLVVLFAGAGNALFRVLTSIENAKISIETIVEKNLLKLSRKNINLSLILVLALLYFHQLRDLFPAEIRSEIWMLVIIITNSFLLTFSLLLSVHKIVPRINIYIEKHSNNRLLKYAIGGILRPLEIAIAATFLFSLKSFITGPEYLIVFLTKSVEIILASALVLFLYNTFHTLFFELENLSEDEGNALDKTLIQMLHMVVRIGFVVVSVMIVMRIVSGKPFTTLIAGLGIGGIAVALAAQDTLKNFFGSIMIMTDKPFRVGERIVAEGIDGVIESIGFRSTRIRTLTGNQVTIPNDKIAQIPIENIGRRATIRRLANIGITYDTPPEKVERALEIVRGILENHEGMLPDFPPRVYFSEFAASSLNIQVLYWYSPPDYWDYMEFSEKVNMKIMKAFAAEGIEFAFPTSTTWLEQADGRSIRLSVEDSMKDRQ